MSYFHTVFTLPHEMSALVLLNKRLLDGLLFCASAATLHEVAGDPKHLGANIDCSACCTPGSEPAPSSPRALCCPRLELGGSRRVVTSSRFFLPVHVLSCAFHGKFTAELKRLLSQDKLQFHGSLKVKVPFTYK